MSNQRSKNRHETRSLMDRQRLCPSCSEPMKQSWDEKKLEWTRVHDNTGRKRCGKTKSKAEPVA